MLLMALLTGNLMAQSEARFGGSGSFNFGLQLVDMDPLNEVTNNFGYDDLSNANVSIGGGGQVYLKQFVLGFKGGFVGQDDVQNSDYTLRYGSGYGMFNIGYNLLQQDRFLLYPSAGFGFFGAGLDLAPRREGTSFEDIFAQPATNANDAITIAAFSTAFELSISGDWFLTQGENAAYGLMLGFTAGYRFAPDATFENRAGTELINPPDFNPGGAFLTLRVGGGYYGSPVKN